ncbi:MAG: hypothetical protein ACMG51_04575 [Ginsengibacter sp.]
MPASGGVCASSGHEVLNSVTQAAIWYTFTVTILLTTGVQQCLPLGQAGGRGREGCGESARGGAGMGGSTPSPASKVANTKG